MTRPCTARFAPERAAQRARASAPKPAFYGIFALCLVALQVVTALHFALVPHAFNRELSGFVHVHVDANAKPKLAQGGANPSSIEHASASCTGEACPLGFAGHASTLIFASDVSALLRFDLAAVIEPAHARALARHRVLSSAPKTSPPV